MSSIRLPISTWTRACYLTWGENRGELHFTGVGWGRERTRKYQERRKQSHKDGEKTRRKLRKRWRRQESGAARRRTFTVLHRIFLKRARADWFSFSQCTREGNWWRKFGRGSTANRCQNSWSACWEEISNEVPERTHAEISDQNTVGNSAEVLRTNN